MRRVTIQVHLYTYDLFAERTGFKLFWGCTVFYPFFYCIGMWPLLRSATYDDISLLSASLAIGLYVVGKKESHFFRCRVPRITVLCGFGPSSVHGRMDHDARRQPPKVLHEGALRSSVVVVVILWFVVVIVVVVLWLRAWMRSAALPAQVDPSSCQRFCSGFRSARRYFSARSRNGLCPAPRFCALGSGARPVT